MPAQGDGKEKPAFRVVRWIASGAGIVAALLVSSNSAATKWGIVIFTAASVLWIVAALHSRIWSLATLNTALFFINLFGVWRWFWA